MFSNHIMSFFLNVVTNKLHQNQSNFRAKQAYTGCYIQRLRAAVMKHLSEEMGPQTGEILLQLSWFLYETGAAAVSLYFLIQVLGCQLGLAQIKDIHPQSVLSSHQWHALVSAPLSLPPSFTHLTFFFFFAPVLLNDRLSFLSAIFVLSVLLCCVYMCVSGGDRALFSTLQANAASAPHTHWEARGRNKKESAVANGITPKLTLTENSLQFPSINKSCSKSLNLKRRHSAFQHQTKAWKTNNLCTHGWLLRRTWG